MSIIRLAVSEDAGKIVELSKGLTVERSPKQRSGFVEYKPFTVEEVARRISKNPFFYIAEEDSLLTGFFSNFSDEKLKDTSYYPDWFSEKLLQNSKPFIYSDQLGVSKEFQGRNVGPRLIRKLFQDLQDTDYKAVWATTSHKPYINLPTKLHCCIYGT